MSLSLFLLNDILWSVKQSLRRMKANSDEYRRRVKAKETPWNVGKLALLRMQQSHLRRHLNHMHELTEYMVLTGAFEEE